MRSRAFAMAPLLVCAPLIPGLLAGQDESSSRALADLPVQEAVPPRLAEVELSRSRACVAALARVAELDRDLEPLARRAARLRALDRGIVLEDSTQVAPFDEADPVESAVRAWFVEDGELGRQWSEGQDEAIGHRRDEARAAIRRRIGEVLEELDARGQGRLSEAGDLEGAVAPCERAILVRPAVLEVCATVESPVCAAAADTAADRAAASLRFVDAPEDLWDVEEIRPWTDPAPLTVQPGGTLGGAATATRARLGNIVVALVLGPLIPDRTELAPEQAEALEANLDSLGFSFDHPRFLFAPTFELRLDAVEPLGGETHYMLHFGDLSDPPSQLVWMAPVGGGGPVRAVFPATPPTLSRLEGGQALTLTAVALEGESEDGVQGEAVYSIALSNVLQERAVGALLRYWSGGQMSEDLRRLVPPDGG